MANAPSQSNDVTAARPNPSKRYICGYSRMGLSCIQGPTDQGACCLTERSTDPTKSCQASECASMCAKAGQCEIADAAKTQVDRFREGLGPCLPLPNTWFSRQTVALNAAILVGGILLLLMALPVRESAFVPGGLSSKHTQILGNRLVSERCSLCHPSSHAGLMSMNAPERSQDALCMKCHESHMPDASMRLAHDLTKNQMQFVEKSGGARGTLVAFSSEATETRLTESQSETACAQCHIEHHGAGADIKAIANKRCQACHQRQFESFTHGHPEFADFPYSTPRRIAFDHSSHAGKHFATKNEQFDCAACHVDREKTGSVGSVFRSVSFERACARCHAEPIQAAVVNGWAVLQLPCLAPEDATVTNLGLGDWPENSLFDYDGEISLPLRMLLSTDPEATVGLKLLTASGRISDVPAEARPTAARSLARGFRILVSEVARQGQAAWTARLESTAKSALQRDLNAAELKLVQELSAGLPPDLFRQMETSWFGRPAKLADAVPSPPGSFRLAATQDPNGGETDSLDDDLLGGSGFSDELDFNRSDVSESLNTSRFDSADSLGNALDDEGEWSKSATAVASTAPMAKLKGADHVSLGGWFLDEDIMALRYMPRGHSDRMLAAWGEYVSILERAPRSARAEPWHSPGALMGEIVPGGCTSCHLVGDSSLQGSEWENWKSIRRPETARLFTKFDHGPHLTLPAVSDCRYCHQLGNGMPLNEQAVEHFDGDLRESAMSRFVVAQSEVAHKLAADFQSMQKSQCVACHHQGGADDGCTQCHNYHVGSLGLEWSHLHAQEK